MQEIIQQTTSAHSEKLANYIKHLIMHAGGHISFAEFMHAALYAPKELGYYNNPNCEKFGKNGDFITAPMLGELFAASLVNQLINIFDNTPSCNKNLLEFGAGNGRLAYQIIKQLTKTNFLLQSYLIIEPSIELQIKQKLLLMNSDLHSTIKQNISWINAVPKNFNGIIIANEVLDALPVNLFKIQNQQISETVVTVKNNNFHFLDITPTKKLADHINKLPINKKNYINNNIYRSEICLLLPKFIATILKNIQQGYFLVFDYGFLAAEYYHPDRNTGTLMCHHQHTCHHDPFFLLGMQDITSHVDFSMVMEIAAKHNTKTEAFSSLANFLIANNIEQEFLNRIQLANQVEQYKLNQEINTLISPTEMGELFKVLLLRKN